MSRVALIPPQASVRPTADALRDASDATIHLRSITQEAE